MFRLQFSFFKVNVGKMAGSRLEKLGTIFTRVNGLIRAGALNFEERPLWFDIYKRFPPKDAPLYERPISQDNVRTILYPEDAVRSRFYSEFGSPGIVHMADTSAESLSQKFVNNYMKIRETVTSDDEAFKLTVQTLRVKGILLPTKEEKSQKEMEKMKKELYEQQKETEDKSRVENVKATVQSLFGTAASKRSYGDENENDFDGIYIDEEMNKR